jgi:DNA-binding XRE family transcriptional regulator
LFGYISPRLMSAMKEDYTIESADDSYTDVTESDWYKQSQHRLRRGGLIQLLRGHKGLSQADLGKLLDVTGKYVSDLEHGRRPVSVKVARKLGAIFERRPERFLPLEDQTDA